LTEDQETELSRLVDVDQVLVADPTLYKLNLLITLTRPLGGNDDQQSNSLAEIHLNYETLMKRRIHWMCNSNKETDPSNRNCPDQLIHDSFASLKNLGRVSELLLPIMKPN
jgi:hypothetical protein